jgi:mono/diheme cytochrome c family protein
MKKLSVHFLIFEVVFLLIFLVTYGHAIETGGCLTCHQYPGLVSPGKAGEFMILHIDEGKYLSSPHGKINCNKCHVKATQVPHTGAAKVNCTVNCHAEDRDKIDAIDTQSIELFHDKEKFAITSLEDKSSCRVCHPLYPHSKDNHVRALVNLHTGFLLCEVCHLKKNGDHELIFAWNTPEKVGFRGEPYGTHEKIDSAHADETFSIFNRVLRIFSSDERKAETSQNSGYSIERIAAFQKVGGKKKLLINTVDNKKALQFIEQEPSLSEEEKKSELEYFHRDIAKKEISVACDQCHSPEGILDFKKLGFSDKKAMDLQYLNIKGLVTKYDTFYFPNLFGH